MKAADDYLKLPYHIRMVRDEDAAGEVAWVASVAELPGCLSQGDAPEEAVTMISETMRAWMETTLALGKTIPVPRSGPGYSGKFQVRLPAGLHEAVALEAEHEGVSLNAYVSTVCWPGRSVGRATSGPEARGTRSSKPQDRPVPVS